MSILKKPIVGDCGNTFTRKIVERGECSLEGDVCNIITHNDTYANLIKIVSNKCKNCEYKNTGTCVTGIAKTNGYCKYFDVTHHRNENIDG